MSLFTKSIQEPVDKKDGLRICIMRRPGENDDWDIWIPKLSPSHELLDAYKYQGLDWEEMKIRFDTEVIEEQNDLLQFITQAAKIQNVTLLCWEETPENCHRRLVAEQCQKIDPSLEVVIK